MPEGLPVRIFADDLTGAADSAAPFTARGDRPTVLLKPADMAEGGVVSLDGATRSLAAGERHAVIEAFAARFARGAGRALLLQKVDSMLRGTIGADVAAMLGALPEGRVAVVAPAYPRHGRTLVGGRLHLGGRPAPEGHPGSASLPDDLTAAGLATHLVTIAELEREDAGTIIDRLAASGIRAIVFDAAGHDHLGRLAAALPARIGRVLAVGSGGLSEAIAGGDAVEARPRQATEPVVAMVGSFAEASARQVAAARGAATVIALGASGWVEAARSGLPREAGEALAAALAARRDIVFAIAAERDIPFRESREPALALAAMAEPAMRQAGALVLSGGDTARASLDRLGIAALTVEGSFESGLPVCSSPAFAGPICLKSGSFGNETSLARLIGALRLGEAGVGENAHV